MSATSASGGPQGEVAPLRIERSDPGGGEARVLIAELDAYQQALYPAASNHLVPVEALRRPNVVFLLARAGEQVVGCAALVEQEGEYGEIKRMYVRPSSRGLGVGRALLKELERQAGSRGLRCLRLETGISQPEALALYERAGFRRRGPFGRYREDPLSLFLQLDLQ
jgi:putative acetyltransferase